MKKYLDEFKVILRILNLMADVEEKMMTKPIALGTKACLLLDKILDIVDKRVKVLELLIKKHKE